MLTLIQTAEIRKTHRPGPASLKLQSKGQVQLYATQQREDLSQLCQGDFRRNDLERSPQIPEASKSSLCVALAR